jgi:hypothetical protein
LASWAVVLAAGLLVAGCHRGARARGARYPNPRAQPSVAEAQPQAQPQAQPTVAEAQPQKGLPDESFVVPAAYALSQGLTARPAQAAFGAGQDRTQLVADFLKRAREAGAVYVSDIALYFPDQRAEGVRGLVECKVDVYPDDGAVAQQPQTEAVPVQRQVSRLVTEQEYHCRQVNVPVSRVEVRVENHCREVKKPVSRYETTYTTQYDYVTKSSRTVPQTRYISEWEFKNECRMEPVPHPVTKTEVQNQCGYEPVTHWVTRPESQVESRPVQPRPAELQRRRLTQSAPACYALPAGEARTGRIEAKLYTRP